MTTEKNTNSIEVFCPVCGEKVNVRTNLVWNATGKHQNIQIQATCSSLDCDYDLRATFPFSMGSKVKHLVQHYEQVLSKWAMGV